MKLCGVMPSMNHVFRIVVVDEVEMSHLRIHGKGRNK